MKKQVVLYDINIFTIMEIKTADCYEYYARAGQYPFIFVFGSCSRFNEKMLRNLEANEYFNIILDDYDEFDTWEEM